MVYNPNWHGQAQQTNFIEVAPSGAGGYPTQYESGGPLPSKKFAQVVWNLSPTLSPTPDDVPANSLVITEIYIDGNTQYVCEALMGSALSDAAWRITRISLNATNGAVLRYAENGAVNLPATDLATVKAYSYS